MSALQQMKILAGDFLADRDRGLFDHATPAEDVLIERLFKSPYIAAAFIEFHTAPLRGLAERIEASVKQALADDRARQARRGGR